MTKASNGEGSVYQRKDGRWVAAVVDPATGRRRSAYVRSEIEATRAARRMATRAESGQVVLAKGATRRTWAEEWERERAGRRRRPSIVAAYSYRLKAYVLPEIGGMRLRELSALDVDDLAHALAARGLSAATIKGALIALAACLSDAVRGRLIDTNPAKGVEVPESAPRTAEVVAPTPEQVRKIVEATHGTELGGLVVLLATTGVRIGEALAAQWADIDLDAGVWAVSRTTTRGADGSVVLGLRTKTGEARRVALPEVTVAALRAQRRRVAERRLEVGPAWFDDDLVFPTGVGTPQHSQNVRKAFRPVASRVG